MSKDIKYYLHLYLGCEAKSSEGIMIYKLSSVDAKGHCMFYDSFGNDMWLGEDFNLLLRPLASITDEEKEELICCDIGEYKSLKIKLNVGDYYPSAKRFTYLLSKQFDLFNLIPDGLAIDSATLKINT